MKKTLRVLSILALVAILFASCENNAEAPKEKTAKDYLFGNAIVSTVSATNEETEDAGKAIGKIAAEELADHVFINYSFDENGVISINEGGYEISDFKGTVEGMSYKVSFTTKVSAEEYEIKSELIFTVLDENTVKITGYDEAKINGTVKTTRYNGTAPIFYAAPKWAAENDYVVTSGDDGALLFFFDQDSLFSLFHEFARLNYHDRADFEASLSSKAGDDSFEFVQSRVTIEDGMNVKYSITHHFDKKANGEIEYAGKVLNRAESEDGLFYNEDVKNTPASKVTPVALVPEWARGIYGLENKENHNYIPVSSKSFWDMYASEMLNFERIVGDGDFLCTVEYKSLGIRRKDAFKFEKTETEGEYEYSFKRYIINEDGSETLDSERQGEVGTGVPVDEFKPS